MPVDKNSEAYKKAIKDMADIVSTKGIRIVGNFFEYDGRFPDATKAVTSLPFILTRLTDLNPNLGADLKTLAPYAGLDMGNTTVYEGEPFDSLSHRGRITFAETNPTLRNQWIEALVNVKKELSASGRTANITDLSEERIETNKNRHDAMKLMVDVLTTPGIRVRGNVVEMDTKSNAAYGSFSKLANIARLLDVPNSKHLPFDGESSSGPAPTIAEQKACGGVYFTNDAQIARTTIGRFSPEVRTAWKTAMQEAVIRASAITNKKIDYQDAPDVATDPDGPGCLSAVPSAVRNWASKAVDRFRGNGGVGGPG
jgi:hypothetical protein